MQHKFILYMYIRGGCDRKIDRGYKEVVTSPNLSLEKKKRGFRKLTSLDAGLKVIPENVHIHPMEGQWKVSNFSKYEAKLELLGGFIFWWKDEG